MTLAARAESVTKAAMTREAKAGVRDEGTDDRRGGPITADIGSGDSYLEEASSTETTGAEDVAEHILPRCVRRRTL